MLKHSVRVDPQRPHIFAALILSIVFCGINAENELPTPQPNFVDGCTIVAQHAAISDGSRSVTIIAKRAATNTGESPTANVLQFNNCALPDDMDITIIIPLLHPVVDDQQPTTVHIEIINTTMHGGSLEIAPPDGGAQQDPTLLAHVVVLVRHSILQCTGNVLLVKGYTTTTATNSVANVHITLEDVLLSSSRGNAASIITTPSTTNDMDDVVMHCHIYVSGNSTVNAKHLVASIQTSKLLHSSLTVSPDATTTTLPRTCVGDPLVQLVAGGSTVSEHVGVLSVFPSSGILNLGAPEALLHVENVTIVVERQAPTDIAGSDSISISVGQSTPSPCTPTTTVQMAATAASGVAAVASIALRHPTHARLTMAGNVTIAVGALFPPVSTTTAQQPIGVIALNATVHEDSAVATIGGIALLAQRSSSDSTTSLHLDDCRLNILVASGGKGGGGVMSATSSPKDMLVLASSVAGIAMNSYSNSGNSVTNITVSNSHIELDYRSVDHSKQGERNNSVDMRSPTFGHYLVSTVSGIAMNSYTTAKSSISSVSIGTSSSVTMHGSSAFNPGNMTVISSSSGDYLASSVFGVAMNSCSVYGVSTTTIAVANGSNLAIGYTASGSQGASLLASPSTRSILATTVLGVAMNSYSRSASQTSMNIATGSTLSIVCAVVNGSSNLNVEAPTSTGSTLASAALGVAVKSHSVTSSSSTTIALTGASNLTLALSLVEVSGFVSVELPSSGGHLASTILGVAANSYCEGTTSKTTITISDASTLAIASRVASAPGAVLQQYFSGPHLASSLLGVAMHNSGATSVNTLSVTNASRLSIDCATTDSQGVAFLLPTSGTFVAASILGVATINSDGETGSGIMTIDRSSTLRIHVLLTNKTTVDFTASRGTMALAAAGVKNGPNSIFQLVEPEGVLEPSSWQDQKRAVVDVWVGLQTSSNITLESSAGRFDAVVLGIVADQFKGLSNHNTALSLCRDDATRSNLRAVGGTVMQTHPEIDGVVVKDVIGWELSPPSHQQQQDHTSLSTSWCETKAMILAAHLAEVFDLLFSTTAFSLPPPKDDGNHPPAFGAKTQTWTPTMPSTTTASHSTLAIPTRTTTGTPSLQPPPPLTKSTSTSPSLTSETRPTVTVVIEPTTTSNPTTAPPPPQKRAAQLTTIILLPDNEEAATAVLSTAGASGAVASTIGSGGGGMVVTAGASVRMMECGLADDNPRPPAFELPLQFALGNGSMKYFAGAVLAHTLIQCLLLGIPVLLRRRSEDEGGASRSSCGKSVRYLSMIFCGGHAFFMPAILGACSTVLNNNDGGSVSVGVTSLCALVITTIHVTVVLAVHRGPQNGLVARHRRSLEGFSLRNQVKLEFKVRSSTTTSSSTTSSDDSNSGSDSQSSDSKSSSGGSGAQRPPPSWLFSAQATKDILLTLFDGCRRYENATHRHYSSVETTLFSVISVISGARPQQNCTAAAFAVGLVAALQLGYVLVVRPFRTRLDTIFSIVNGAVLLTLSMAVAISVQRRGDQQQQGQEEWTLKIVEACLWLVSCLGFVQLAVQGYWAYHVAQRRLRLQGEGENSGSDSSSSSSSDQSSTSSNDSNRSTDPILVVEMVELEHAAKGADTTASNMTTENSLHSNPLLEQKLLNSQ